MVKKYFFLIFLIPFFLFSEPVALIKIDTTINPVVSDFVKKSIRNSENSFSAVILQLNTPGGLLDSTRDIIEEILNSKIPIICYVGPKGARAASAGFFILISCDLSIMNLNTTTGAATPISVMGIKDDNSMKKIIEDTSSYAKTLAQRKKIDIKPVLDAVNNGKSYTCDEAKRLGIVDLVVNDFSDIKDFLLNKKIQKNGIFYSFSDIEIKEINMPWYKKIISYIYNPTLVYILLILGIYGIIFEFFTPGIGFPGIFGIFSLIFALVGLAIIPINYGGLFLIILGIILFIFEVFFVSYGLLTLGGAFFLILGSFLYFDRIVNVYTITITVITLLISFLLILVVSKSIRLKKSENFIGLVNKIGTVKEEDPLIVLVEGELWQGVSKDVLKKGDRVKVIAVSGLIIEVKKSIF